MKLNCARICDWLFVGNKLACGTVPASGCLHINRSDRPDKDCDRCDSYYEKNWHIDYLGGHPLTDDHWPVLNEIVLWLGDDSKRSILIHCNAGGCRSPTIAAFIYGAMVADAKPLDGFAVVEKAIYEQRGKLCNIVYQPKLQIVNALRARYKLPEID